MNKIMNEIRNFFGLMLFRLGVRIITLSILVHGRSWLKELLSNQLTPSTRH